MINDMLLNLFSLGGLIKVLHALITVLIGMYFFFSLIVIRQVALLNKSLKTDATFLLTAVAYANLFATILLLLFSVIALI